MCPSCHAKKRQKQQGVQMFECGRCRALYGTLYLGDSYAYVLPYFVTPAREREIQAEQQAGADPVRYYDFECLGSSGIQRRHGWFDAKTRRIVQVG